MIYKIEKGTIGFPDPREGDDDGLFAVGGDLSVEQLMTAYTYGIFPWFAFRPEETAFLEDDGTPMVQWWCPMERFVIFPNEIHISHSMRTLLNKNRYLFSFNKAFEQVIDNCGKLREDEVGAWLGPDIKRIYTELHKLGIACSVEVWDPTEQDGYNKENPQLVGGLYGILTSNVFCGESMFSLVPSGSKLALIYLSKFLEEHGISLIDCQLETPHLKSMGGRYISYDEYMRIMDTDIDYKQ